jgi:hypothetical protein
LTRYGEIRTVMQLARSLPHSTALDAGYSRWHPNADSWRIKARSLRLALLHTGAMGQESGSTKDKEGVMKSSMPVAVMADRAVDILIYTLSVISIALALAMGVSILLFSF